MLAGFDNGDVKMFDLRTNKARARADAPSVCPSHHIVSMSAAIQFSDTPHLLARVQLRWETNVSNGVCGVSFDRRDICMNKFLVSCLEARFHVFDARTQHPVKVSEAKPDAHVLVTSQPATSSTWRSFHIVAVSMCSGPHPRCCISGLCRCITIYCWRRFRLRCRRSRCNWRWSGRLNGVGCASSATKP